MPYNNVIVFLCSFKTKHKTMHAKIQARYITEFQAPRLQFITSALTTARWLYWQKVMG